MAYLRPLPRCRDCGRPASEELCNDRNAPQGRYCTRHAKAALRRFEHEMEERHGRDT